MSSGTKIRQPVRYSNSEFWYGYKWRGMTKKYKCKKIKARIDDLSKLEKGWYQASMALVSSADSKGQSKAITKESIALCYSVLSELIMSGGTPPSICPTFEGELICEWDIGPWSASIEFGEKTHGLSASYIGHPPHFFEGNFYDIYCVISDESTPAKIANIINSFLQKLENFVKMEKALL